MAIRAKNPSWSTVLLLLVIGILWGIDRWKKSSGNDSSRGPSARQEEKDSRTPRDTAPSAREGAYELYHGCVLAAEKNNDGDSFEVRLPDGRSEIFRLYFVDTPESAFKNYGRGETNSKRIGEQAAALGGITPEQAVEVGKKAKAYILGLLANQSFSLYTEWDSPFDDRRYHAFIRVKEGGKERWLDELLVERGFCRIHTKGADLPDGTPMSRHKDRLRSLEREAKERRAGAWGLR